MLDEQDGDLEVVANLLDVLHELVGLVGIHARGRLVEEEHLGVGRQRADDLETALGAIGKVARLGRREPLHVEDAEKVERPVVELRLLPPVLGKTEHVGEEARGHRVAETHEDVLLDRHLVEETDVLERARDAHLVDFDDALARGVVPVEENRPPRRTVDVGEQVEDRGLARAVGADETGDLGAAHGDVEVVDRREATEVDAEVVRLEDGLLAEVALGNQVGRLHLDEDGPPSLIARHRRSPPPWLPASSSRESRGS